MEAVVSMYTASKSAIEEEQLRRIFLAFLLPWLILGCLYLLNGDWDNEFEEQDSGDVESFEDALESVGAFEGEATRRILGTDSTYTKGAAHVRQPDQAHRSFIPDNESKEPIFMVESDLNTEEEALASLAAESSQTNLPTSFPQPVFGRVKSTTRFGPTPQIPREKIIRTPGQDLDISTAGTSPPSSQSTQYRIVPSALQSVETPSNGGLAYETDISELIPSQKKAQPMALPYAHTS